MSVKLIGVLKDPGDVILPNAIIRFVSTQGFGEMVAPTYYEFHTDGLGGYNFDIVFGYYSIEVLQDKYDELGEYRIIGDAVVSSATPDPITLGELLQYTTPIANEDIIALDLDWTQRFDNLTLHYDTITQELETTLQDGDTYAINLMQTFTNETLGAQMAILRDEVSTGDATATNEMRAYSDNAGNQLANRINQVSTDVNSANQSLIAYVESNGNALTSLQTTLEQGDASVLSEASIYADGVSGRLELTISDALYSGNDSISNQISIVKDQSGITSTYWQVSSTVAGITSAIGMTNAQGEPTELYILADRFSFMDATTQIKPFYIEDGSVHLRNVVIEPSTSVASANASIPIFIHDQELKLNNEADSSDPTIKWYVLPYTVPAGTEGAGYMSVKIKGNNFGQIQFYYNGLVIADRYYADTATEDRWFSIPINISSTGDLRIFMINRFSPDQVIQFNEQVASGELSSFPSIVDMRTIIKGIVVTKGGIGDPEAIMVANNLYDPNNQTRTSIRSSDFLSGVSGWAIYDNGGDNSSGDVEFNDGTFRGDIIANSLTLTNGATIPPEIDNNNIDIYPDQDSLQISSAGYQQGVDGWAISANGNSEFNNVVVRGTVHATTGTIGEDCDILGTLNANNIEGDVLDRAVVNIRVNIPIAITSLAMRVPIVSGTILPNPALGRRYLSISGLALQHVNGAGSTSNIWVRLMINGIQKMIIHSEGWDEDERFTTVLAAALDDNVTNTFSVTVAGRVGHNVAIKQQSILIDVFKQGSSFSNITAIVPPDNDWYEEDP